MPEDILQNKQITSNDDYMSNLLLRADWISEVAGLPVTICWFDEQHGIQKHILGEDVFSDFFMEIAIQDFQLQKRTMENPIVMTFDPGFLIGILQATEDKYIIVGPAPIGPLRQTDLFRKENRLFPADTLPQLYDALMRSPMYSVRRFMKLILLIQHSVSGVQGTIGIVMDNNSIVKVDHIPVSQYEALYKEREVFAQHSPVKWEKRLLDAIKSGDSQKLKKAITAPMPGNAGKMSEDTLRQTKYIFVSFTTLAARAALEGGVPAEIAFSLSDAYCRSMDDLTDPQEIYVLLFKMAMDYASHVANANWRKDLSISVQKCCEYIGKHLHEPISLEDLSQHCGLSSRRTSARFIKETGLTIPEYIHRERMEEAKYLLSFTNMPLGEISANLQYSSQSYFTKKFREFFDVTPQAYRDSTK